MSRCVVLSIGAVALRDSGPRRPVAVRLPEESSDRIPDAGPNPGAGASPFRQRPQPLVAEPHVRRGRTKPPIASAKVLFFPSDLQKAGDKLVAAGCFSDFRCRCRYCRRCCCRCRCCCCCRSRRSGCSGSFDYLRCSGHSVRSDRSFAFRCSGARGSRTRTQRAAVGRVPEVEKHPRRSRCRQGRIAESVLSDSRSLRGVRPRRGRSGRTGGPVVYSAVAGRMTTFTRLASSRIFRAMRRTSSLPSARTAFS